MRLKFRSALAFALMLLLPAQAHAESLIEKLKNETPESFVDAGSNKHEIYFSSSHPQFLKLIEESIANIAQTHMGQSLFQHVLGCDSAAISRHLGVSSQKSLELAARCFQNSRENSHRSPYILESQGDKIDPKISIIPGSSQRQYVLVLSETLNWAIDSWTDPISNKTVFIIGKTEAGEADYKGFFYKMMAHELAIYFDTKAWVGSSEWNSIPSFRVQLEFASEQGNKLALALNNPLISQLFRSLRAFKAEQIIMEQLVKEGKLPASVMNEYENPEADYYRQDCDAPCIFSFVKIYSPLLLPQSLPLLAFTPQYRSQKLLEIFSQRSLNDRINNPEWKLAISALEKHADSYLSNIFKNDPFFDMMAPKKTAEQSLLFKETSLAFRDTLLPQDLETISELVLSYSPFAREFLRFLATPQLGGTNVRMSGGPRPRIRPWGYYINLINLSPEIFNFVFPIQQRRYDFVEF